MAAVELPRVGRPTAWPAPTGAAIAGLGTALPSTSVPNAAIAERLDVDDHWIFKRTGVRERRVAQPGERLTDLAVSAAREALRSGGVDASELDLVLVGTFTQDELLPNAAPQVAAALGAASAGAVDLGAACMGFLAGLSLAAGYVEAGRARRALVVGADMLTRYLDPLDRGTAALIGDGAGAVVVTAVRPPGRIAPAILRAEDESRELVSMTRAEATLRMDGQQTYACAVDHLVAVSREAVAAAGVALEDIDLFVYHQANARITRAVAGRLRLRPARVVDCIERLGNTSAASIPLALAAAEREGRLHDGALVLLAACGAGFTWGAVVLEWGTDDA
jgi:3-oxoacyl-[acyl-carrier-protein] synthase-3